MKVTAVITARLAFVRALAAVPHPLTAGAVLFTSVVILLAPMLSAAQNVNLAEPPVQIATAAPGSTASNTVGVAASSVASPVAGPVSSTAASPTTGSASKSTPPLQVKSPAPTQSTVTQGLRWRDLTTSQQLALQPLVQDWADLDGPRRQKWVQLADRLPKMLPAEQARVQARMADWAKLTPQQRGQTRLNFQEATQLPSKDRQARWDAYQALAPEQKRELAARAASGAAMPASGQMRKLPTTETSAQRTDASGQDPSQAKSNLVPNHIFANRPSAISPTVVRASPGATTTIISKQAAPPSHQQAGMPKIAATPAFVNKTTLLPLRGPQGAAIHPEPASAASGASRP